MADLCNSLTLIFAFIISANAPKHPEEAYHEKDLSRDYERDITLIGVGTTTLMVGLLEIAEDPTISQSSNCLIRKPFRETPPPARVTGNRGRQSYPSVTHHCRGEESSLTHRHRSRSKQASREY